MAAIRGDFGKLEKLIKKLDQLSHPSFRQKLSKNVSEEAIELVKEEFETGTDPYGKAWPKPLIRTGNGGIKPLAASGRLKNSFHVAEVTPQRFTIETNIIYASVHQYGATIKAKNWRTVTIRIDMRARMARHLFSKKMQRKFKRAGLTEAAIRAGLKAQFPKGGDNRYKTITVKRFGLVFRGVHTTRTDYTGKNGNAKRSTSRKYGDWITKLSVKIPQRQIIPENTLPPKWIEAFKSAAKDVINEHFGYR